MITEPQTYIALFAMSFLCVGVRAFQQQNVTHRRYKLIVPTSYVFSFVDLFVLYYGLNSFSHAPILTGFIVGTAAWLGCWASIFLHTRI